MKNIFKIAFLMIFSVALTSCASQEPVSVLKDPSSYNPNMMANLNKAAPDNTATFEDDEKTVVISANNFGRANPFKPYQETSLIKSAPVSINTMPVLSVPSLNVPPPPTLQDDTAISDLLKVKVNGILYDPNGSSAIINVNDTDYIVHKGDTIFSYYVKNITFDKVILKYGNNTYRAGIGEIIDGDVNINPVVRRANQFNSTQSVNSLPEIKLVDPTYLPPLR